MSVSDYIVDCRKGLHDLIEIYRGRGREFDEVVRWCRICGGIVVDHEKDYKLIGPGKGMNMMSPLIYYNKDT